MLFSNDRMAKEGRFRVYIRGPPKRKLEDGAGITFE